MAKAPKPAKQESDADKMERTANERLVACRVWKDYFVLDFKECYFFTSPWRQRQLLSTTQPAQQRLLDAPELNTDKAFLLAGDFVTEIVNTYMPEAQRWCERGRGQLIPKEAWDSIKEQVHEDDGTIFDAMKASNLYSEVTKAFYPDLAIGTCAMWIERKHPARPISVLAVPLRELECNLGPDGEIDDRWAIRYTRNCYVQELVGEEIWNKSDFPKAIKDVCGAKPSDRTEVRFGFWRLWDRHDDECWKAVVMVGKALVHSAELVGEGSCPLIVPRFNPTADWPWGFGPMMQGLPSFRQIDEMEMQQLEHAERSYNPPFTFPDDSITNIEQGLEPGMAYPIRPGTQDSVKPIVEVAPPTEENYAYGEKLQTLKKLFFVDFPEQTGDTPPTLGQWLDEMARAQRRIGTPGLPFWREGPCKIFLRFKFLLEAAGAIAPLKVDGRNVAAVPYNPAQRAAEQQEIATAVQFSQLMGQMFPEEWKLAVDGRVTMEAFADKMRITGLVKFRDKKQVAAALAQIAQLVGGQQPGGEQAPPAQAAA